MHYRWEKKVLYLNCSVQPKTNEDRIVGLVSENLKIRIPAAPINGKANKQLIRFLAKLFHTKRTAIAIVSGLTGRHKRLCVKKPLSIRPGLEIPKDTLP